MLMDVTTMKNENSERRTVCLRRAVPTADLWPTFNATMRRSHYTTIYISAPKANILSTG